MALDQSIIGRSYPSTEPYEVGREKIREFADAIGDVNPVYRDTESAKGFGHPDVIAPPTFSMVVAMRALMPVMEDSELRSSFTHVIHGDQRFVYDRPVRVGDRLSATATISNFRSMAGNAIITVTTDIVTVEGEHVVTAYSTLVAANADNAN
jgi:acyl dehydratase